jgi:hypothetical protein
MILYIKVINGEFVGHPALEENLVQAFGSVPSDWEPFNRITRPEITGLYETYGAENPLYQKINGVWTDVWVIRHMTDEEKAAKQQAARDDFNSREQAENWSAWLIDEATCEMVPPIPRPEPDQAKLDAGIKTFWCGAENNWKDTPVIPADNNQYKFDFIAWEWAAA